MLGRANVVILFRLVRIGYLVTGACLSCHSAFISRVVTTWHDLRLPCLATAFLSTPLLKAHNGLATGDIWLKVWCSHANFTGLTKIHTVDIF